MTGSIRIARRVGIQHANPVMAQSSAVITTKVSGSVGVIWISQSFQHTRDSESRRESKANADHKLPQP